MNRHQHLTPGDELDRVVASSLGYYLKRVEWLADTRLMIKDWLWMLTDPTGKQCGFGSKIEDEAWFVERWRKEVYVPYFSTQTEAIWAVLPLRYTIESRKFAESPGVESWIKRSNGVILGEGYGLTLAHSLCMAFLDWKENGT